MAPISATSSSDKPPKVCLRLHPQPVASCGDHIAPLAAASRATSVHQGVFELYLVTIVAVMLVGNVSAGACGGRCRQGWGEDPADRADQDRDGEARRTGGDRSDRDRLPVVTPPPPGNVAREAPSEAQRPMRGADQASDDAGGPASSSPSTRRSAGDVQAAPRGSPRTGRARVLGWIAMSTMYRSCSLPTPIQETAPKRLERPVSSSQAAYAQALVDRDPRVGDALGAAGFASGLPNATRSPARTRAPARVNRSRAPVDAPGLGARAILYKPSATITARERATSLKEHLASAEGHRGSHRREHPLDAHLMWAALVSTIGAGGGAGDRSGSWKTGEEINTFHQADGRCR